jgi:3-methylcrotonyl-CoA carboxylase alpha subunit
MIQKLLIANRGEIVARIAKTAKKMGIETVAIFSEADEKALHTRVTDYAFRLNGDPQKVYLDQTQILEIAEREKVDAIHPGYGFLSENPHFARECEKRNIIFVGPKPESIEDMGLKDASKSLVASHGVPVLQGYYAEQSLEAFKHAAHTIEYPVLIKPAAGGGGKGMHIARSEKDLEDLFHKAKREAMNSFGNDRLLIEKFLENPRHIEVQILFDKFGHGIYLFERDCTLQRRHQKVIEEAPSPLLTPSLRLKLGEMALNAAKAVGYINAGTVECLYDPEANQFYFMEMNTRLQVEHPVTEMITGIDLVEWQLKIASGLPLTLKQDDLTLNGHAVEARLYAEDPQNNFLPAVGNLKHLSLPHELPGVRIDQGVEEGDDISIYYDPMIAKVIAWGKTREAALVALQGALYKSEILGLKTNLGFLEKLITHKNVERSDYSTRFIETHINDLLPQQSETSLNFLLAVAACTFLYLKKREISCNPWEFQDYFRTNEWATQKIILNDIPIFVEIQKDQWVIKVREETFFIKSLSFSDNKIALEKEGKRYSFQTYTENQKLFLWAFHQQFVFEKSLFTVPQKDSQKHHDKSIKSPMPGKIIKIFVDAKQKVEAHTPLIVLEAMKMEHVIKAPMEGTIESIFFKEGDIVQEGSELVRFAEA